MMNSLNDLFSDKSTKYYAGFKVREDNDLHLLTPHQREEADKLIEYLCNQDSEYDFARLRGYAGTGKSFTLARVFDALIGNGIGISAPTHKAVRVIKKASENPMRFEFATIHSLLGLQQTISDKGVVSYKKGNSLDRRIDSLQLLVVDESSMLDTVLLGHLLDHIKDNPGFKLVFCGDPLQAPPVGEQNSPAFRNFSTDYNVLDLELSEPMRQASDNPILGYATAIRQQIHSETDFRTFLNQEQTEAGLELVPNDGPDFTSKILSLFGDEFDKDSDYMKVLAWTNDQVNASNAAIRRHRLKTPFPAKIVLGEYLIADSPIFKVGNTQKSIIIYTSEEMEVMEMEVKTMQIPWSLQLSRDEMLKSLGNDPDRERKLAYMKSYTSMSHDFKVYACKVRLEREGVYVYYDIYILHEDEEEYYKKVVAALKNSALRAYNTKEAWRQYYGFQECFAQVKYNYALTIHKAQGSSYDNCAVILSDVNRNRKIVGGKDIKIEERNRLKYVAVTRAKQKLFIIN